MATLNHKTSEHKANQPLSPLPNGKYTVVADESEMKPTKAGNGRYLKLRLKVAEGDFKGRSLFVNLNIENPNPEAVRIARGELTSICNAVGKTELQDSVELHNIPFVVEVVCKPRSDKPGEMQNDVVDYLSKQHREPANTQPAGGDAPWKA